MTDLTTQSSWSCFKTCRKKYHFRYEQKLVPRGLDRIPLLFGRDWDQILNAHYTGKTTADLVAHSAFRATIAPMWAAYLAKYAKADESWRIATMQRPFAGPIINPETNAASRTFSFAGVADGLVWRDGQQWLLENKTTSRIDAAYLDRLWLDWQTTLYAAYLEPLVGPIAGVIWNLAQKPGIKRRQSETQTEFEERRAALKNPDKATRKVEETDSEWSARVAEWYTENPGAFHREEIILDRDDIQLAKDELWDLAQSAMEARRRGRWYRNTAACHHFGSSCDYLPLCRSKESPIVRDASFVIDEPHQEYTRALAEAKG